MEGFFKYRILVFPKCCFYHMTKQQWHGISAPLVVLPFFCFFFLLLAVVVLGRTLFILWIVDCIHIPSENSWKALAPNIYATDVEHCSYFSSVCILTILSVCFLWSILINSLGFNNWFTVSFLRQLQLKGNYIYFLGMCSFS